MKKTTQQNKAKYSGILKFFGLGVVVGVALLYIGLRIGWKGKIYPGVVVGNMTVGGQNIQQAVENINDAINNNEVRIVFNSYEWVVPKELFTYQVDESVREAYRYGRQISAPQFATILTGKKQIFPVKVRIATSELDAWLDTVAQSVEITPVPASIVINRKKIEIVNGVDGTLLNRNELVDLISKAATMLSPKPVSVTTRPSNKQLNEEQLATLEAIATKLMSEKLLIEVDDQTTTLTGDKLISFISTDHSASSKWDLVTIDNYVKSLAETFDRESENARFEMVGDKVKEFAPGKNGVRVQIGETKQILLNALEKIINQENAEKVVAAFVEDPPKVSTGDVNKLGIEKRIGKGESYYAHSIPGRIHNVALTSSRITSALVPPGEEFSFNNTVGEISGATGYAPAYVIKNGRTELGDGGGVCQVSTTVFRAALSAGLPITERWAHAYRVGYYEQGSEPGIDATIFSPSKDLRFRNDTPGHILIQAINDPKTLHLIIEIYGTDDGRKSEVSKVKVWGSTPPPPDLYQDDPTLAQGKIRQVDWSAWGAKTTFDYKVTKNGETIYEKSFPSTYRAWQNVYLRGTKVD